MTMTFENVMLIVAAVAFGGIIALSLKWLVRRAERKRRNALPIDIEDGIRATREAVTANMLSSWQDNWFTASNALMPSMTTQQIIGPEISARLQELASTPTNKPKRTRKTKLEKVAKQASEEWGDTIRIWAKRYEAH